MKKIVKSSLVLLCAAVPSIYACSQTPSPAIAPPPPGAPGGPGRTLQELITVQGTVKAYTTSDSNQYDGLSLQTGSQTVSLRFPPHMAANLMAAAKPGASISVQGFYETTPEGANAVHLVNATAGSQTIQDTPPAAPATPPTANVQTYTGTITAFHKDRSGMTNGVILSGNRLIDLGPGVYDQLQASLKTGTSISVSGSVTTPPAGVVLVQQIQTIHPQTLTLNGQTYMVR